MMNTSSQTAHLKRHLKRVNSAGNFNNNIDEDPPIIEDRYIGGDM